MAFCLPELRCGNWSRIGLCKRQKYDFRRPIKKAKEATNAAVKAAAGGEFAKESEPEIHKSMSIAERANLTKRLDDKEEDEKE